MTSAYPLTHDDLVARVRQLAVDLGEMPSQNRIVYEFRVGKPKAKAALDALADAGFAPSAGPTHGPSTGPTSDVPGPSPGASLDARPVGLHVVPNVPTEARTGAAEKAVEPPPGPAPVLGTPGTGTSSGDDVSVQVTGTAEPVATRRRVPRWPLLVIALGAFVSIWSGWVGLGRMAGFGPVVLLPGIADGWVINSAITLPLGVEAYAAFAMFAWLSDRAVSTRARRFARWSAIAALGLGVFGQATYHLLVTSGAERAPGQVVVFVSCLPVLVLGAGAALAHLLMSTDGAA